MTFALKLLRETIANRRNQILGWQAQLKRGGDAVSEESWLAHIEKCKDEIGQCERALVFINEGISRDAQVSCL